MSKDEDNKPKTEFTLTKHFQTSGKVYAADAGMMEYMLHIRAYQACSGQLFSYHPVGGFYHLNAFSTSAGVA